MRVLNEAHEQAKAGELQALVIDFDEDVEEWEREHQPIVVKLGGHKYKIPSNTPTDFAVFYLRHCLSERNGKLLFAVPEDKVDRFLELMLGPEILEHLAGSPVPLNVVLQRLVPRVFDLWGLDFTPASGGGASGEGSATRA